MGEENSASSKIDMILCVLRMEKSLRAKVFKNRRFVDAFLDNKTHSCQHGKATIVQFLVLHFNKFLRRRWFQTKWVESNVTRIIRILQFSAEVLFDFWRWHPAYKAAVKLGRSNRPSQQLEENRSNLAYFSLNSTKTRYMHV